jgi:hypothetical protein
MWSAAVPADLLATAVWREYFAHTAVATVASTRRNILQKLPHEEGHNGRRTPDEQRLDS